jgi:hypothetical protein
MINETGRPLCASLEIASVGSVICTVTSLDWPKLDRVRELVVASG